MALLILAASFAYTLNAPPVPDASCAGGWNLNGVFYPKEQGGCCKGTECCKCEVFKDMPACVSSTMPACSGLDCCQSPKYAYDPLCPGTPQGEDGCTGLDCCKLGKYKNTPLCITSLPTNPEPPECSKIPPKCPIGGIAPLLTDPLIASGSLCRGACGGPNDKRFTYSSQPILSGPMLASP